MYTPATQRLLDEFTKAACGEQYNFKAGIAAALRATTKEPYEVPVYVQGDDYWRYRDGVDSERERNLAIAAELEDKS